MSHSHQHKHTERMCWPEDISFMCMARRCVIHDGDSVRNTCKSVICKMYVVTTKSSYVPHDHTMYIILYKCIMSTQIPECRRTGCWLYVLHIKRSRSAINRMFSGDNFATDNAHKSDNYTHITICKHSCISMPHQHHHHHH